MKLLAPCLCATSRATWKSLSISFFPSVALERRETARGRAPSVLGGRSWEVGVWGC